MATPYVTPDSLKLFYGAATVDAAVSQTGMNLQAVIDSQCATVDRYVRKVSPIPPIPEAIEQLAPIAMKLVRLTLFYKVLSEADREQREELLRELRDIQDGKTSLPGSFEEEVVEDDPDTEEDESAMSGSAPRDWEPLF